MTAISRSDRHFAVVHSGADVGAGLGPADRLRISTVRTVTTATPEGPDSGRVVDIDLEQVEAVPPSSGVSFRGGPVPDWWQVGDTYVEPGWLHTSRDPLVATDTFATSDVVAVFGEQGRDLLGLNDRPEEQETVFLPGSRFTVERQGRLGDLWVTVIVVHRDDHRPEAPFAVDEELRRVASVVERARPIPRGTVQVDRPDRFAGPFGTRPHGGPEQ